MLRVVQRSMETVGINSLEKGDLVVVGYNQIGVPELD